jgi:hypothetical protein
MSDGSAFPIAGIGSQRRSSSTIWLYPRFTLSYRDVEDLLAKRGLDISHETVRRWALKFGPLIARKLAAAPTAAERSMAPRRDGGSDRRQVDLSAARR